MYDEWWSFIQKLNTLHLRRELTMKFCGGGWQRREYCPEMAPVCPSCSKMDIGMFKRALPMCSGKLHVGNCLGTPCDQPQVFEADKHFHFFRCDISDKVEQWHPISMDICACDAITRQERLDRFVNWIHASAK